MRTSKQRAAACENSRRASERVARRAMLRAEYLRQMRPAILGLDDGPSSWGIALIHGQLAILAHAVHDQVAVEVA